ncbi:hypothetical protein KIPB_005073 [Kipferlia bialata]|uniref:Methyltransferase type 11 domain-containing protein n=1 Tax=Kipferlia bialata TaxID=797122 RepID=A0A9K3GIN1_9EUKA|nr:hypothetical protein KIPB_005073 [Kipferlia bialata]|eukprot:g5073.t1
MTPTPFFEDQTNVDKYIASCEGCDGYHLVDTLVSECKVQGVDTAASSVLELGSGPGTDGKYLSSFFKDTLLSDHSSLFVKRLQSLGLSAVTVDASDINLPPASRDVVFSNKVLQHLDFPSFRASFQSQHRLLKEGGLACHSLWYGTDSMMTGTLLHQYHTEETLATAIKGLFTVVSMHRYEEFEPEDSMVVVLKRV